MSLLFCDINLLYYRSRFYFLGKNGYFIQISVPIDHGSSGGALINCYGEVIGITSGGRDDSGANLNFARDIRAIFTSNY